jgi:hypothetical protein
LFRRSAAGKREASPQLVVTRRPPSRSPPQATMAPRSASRPCALPGMPARSCAATTTARGAAERRRGAPGQRRIRSAAEGQQCGTSTCAPGDWRLIEDAAVGGTPSWRPTPKPQGSDSESSLAAQGGRHLFGFTTNSRLGQLLLGQPDGMPTVDGIHVSQGARDQTDATRAKDRANLRRIFAEKSRTHTDLQRLHLGHPCT